MAASKAPRRLVPARRPPAGIVFAALRAADDTLDLPPDVHQRYSALLSRTGARARGSLVTMLRCTAGERRRVARTALQYTCYTPEQGWRSARYSVWNSFPQASAAQKAAVTLSGE